MPPPPHTHFPFPPHLCHSPTTHLVLLLPTSEHAGVSLFLQLNRCAKTLWRFVSGVILNMSFGCFVTLSKCITYASQVQTMRRLDRLLQLADGCHPTYLSGHPTLTTRQEPRGPAADKRQTFMIKNFNHIKIHDPLLNWLPMQLRVSKFSQARALHKRHARSACGCVIGLGVA